MATPRKRTTSGFTSKPVEEPAEEIKKEESVELFEMLDVVSTELFESLEQTETVSEPYTAPEITPTEDIGPRFVDIEHVEPVTPAPAPAPAPAPVIKRHPRNVPKFSRLDK